MAIIEAPNFSYWEFACANGDPFPDPIRLQIARLACNLQALRDTLRKPITITSGYRSIKYNTELIARGVGASKNSQHILGKAADIHVFGVSPDGVAAEIERLIDAGAMTEGGVGVYAPKNEQSTGFVHYDIRGTRARWRG